MNENNLNFNDVQHYVYEQIEKVSGIKVAKSKQKDLLIEALCRNIVMNELMDMIVHIVKKGELNE